jgi:hypothetical protein
MTCRDCQLQGLEESVHGFARLEEIPRLILRNLWMMYKKLESLIKGIIHRFFPRSQKGSAYVKTPVTVQSLDLQRGEKVRVKTIVEIQRTLDVNGKYHGLTFTTAQSQYCGGIYKVQRRLEKVFDERRWKLSKIKDTVLLENVVCNGVGGIHREWDGCDRQCLLWWKEAWLEKVDG